MDLENNTELTELEVHSNSKKKYIALLNEEIGSGGQGIIVKEKSCSNIVIKLFTKKKQDNSGFEFISKDSPDFEKYQEKLQFLDSLPIDPDLKITIPIDYLKNYAGYVINILDYMSMVRGLISNYSYQDINSINFDLTLNFYRDHKNIQSLKRYFYRYKTGGLKLRLSVARQIAFILASLHEKNLVFGDISPNNFLYLRTDHSSEPIVWAIDTDNINFSGKGYNIYTSKYVAPEIYLDANKNPTVFSDCYSFAILCFEILTDIHPFCYVSNSSQDVDFYTLVENVDAGLVPWLFDRSDKSNAYKDNIDKNLILKFSLTLDLFNLFAQCFEFGRDYKNIRLRPTMAMFYDCLYKAEQRVIKCPECGFDFYYDDNIKICPLCKSKINNILAIYALDYFSMPSSVPNLRKEHLIFAVALDKFSTFNINKNIVINDFYLDSSNKDQYSDVWFSIDKNDRIYDQDNKEIIIKFNDNSEVLPYLGYMPGSKFSSKSYELLNLISNETIEQNTGTERFWAFKPKNNLFYLKFRLICNGGIYLFPTTDLNKLHSSIYKPLRIELLNRGEN